MMHGVKLHTREFSCSLKRCHKIDWRKEFDSLRINEVKPLPQREIVELPRQAMKPKSDIAIDNLKTPLVLVHGLFGSKQNYTSVGRHIASLTGREVFGLDMRNHGSAPHAAPHNYITMARDTINHLEKSIKQPVVLAGHLMGAKVSMLVSLIRPELVGKLIVIDNSPASQSLDEQFYRDLLGLCHLERDKSLPKLQKSVMALKRDKMLSKYENDKLVRLFLLSNLVRRQSRNDNLPIKFRVPVLNFLKDDVLRELGQWPPEVEHLTFDKPVKVMKAEHSSFITQESLDSHFPKYFPNRDVSVYNCGHWLVSEMPERFVKETVEFLELK